MTDQLIGRRYADEPDVREHHAERKGIRILRFASFGTTPSAMRWAGELRNPAVAYSATGVGDAFSFYPVAGDGLYVVDCPIGWGGRLVLNDGTPMEIYPGMVIPERYSRLQLIDLPAFTAPFPRHAANPIVLAVGPRADRFRWPGWRRHFWLAQQTGIVALNIAPAGNASTPQLQLNGYDAWTPILFNSVQTTWTLRLQYADVVTAAPLLTVTPTGSAVVPVNQLFPLITLGPRMFQDYKQAAAVQHVINMSGGLFGVAGNTLLAAAGQLGWSAETVSVEITNTVIASAATLGIRAVVRVG